MTLSFPIQKAFLIILALTLTSSMTFIENSAKSEGLLWPY